MFVCGAQRIVLISTVLREPAYGGSLTKRTFQKGSEYDGLFVWCVLDAMARRRTLAAACEVLGAASVKRLRLYRCLREAGVSGLSPVRRTSST